MWKTSHRKKMIYTVRLTIPTHDHLVLTLDLIISNMNVNH